MAKGLKKYFNDFSFKHPTPNDIKRSMEKVSGIHLDWYLNEWTQTTHKIDYGVKSVDGKTITLERIGQMPMPIDLEVEYTDGSKETFNIPLRMMRGVKPTSATILKDWGWAFQIVADVGFTLLIIRNGMLKLSLDPSVYSTSRSIGIGI